MDENGTLAGSAMDMSRAVRNAMGLLGLDLREAVTMASAAPAAFLGLGDHMATSPRACAPILLWRMTT